MGASDLHHLLAASHDLKGMVLESTRRRRNRRNIKRSNGGYRWSTRAAAGISMKRRRVLPEGSRRPMNEMEKKVRSLKKLIPNGSSSMGLDGLFMETAGYIESLEMQVKVMQVLVKALSGCSDE
ncbi:hypothetical protein NE237_012801 [Protea cynaroides]|uniref:Uncharacterized protein n=1 Tax=Protea cynaroides TaxID=273540 RepID=A0A9Q0H0H6_9MAGN|nr:hypothetical protein NE237_012801 [Protea cynaroides]